MAAINYSRYFVLEKQIKAKGLPIDRKELLIQYTEGKISSFKDPQLTEAVFRGFCNWVEKSYEVKKKEDWQNTPENTMRRKIIALFKEIGYTVAGGKADMKAINTWSIKKGYLHKPLNEYTLKELPTLVSQAEMVNRSCIKATTKK